MAFLVKDAGACSATDVAVSKDLEHLDYDLMMKITNKRKAELARRQKLADPRTRQFGVSHEVLAEQIKQKQAAQAADAQDEEAYAASLTMNDAVLQTIEGIKSDTRRQKQMETIAYSIANHHKETRREWPLSDPSKYMSAYLTVPEDKLGPCSMSRFEGEQVDKEKIRMAKQETARVLKQQMQERWDRENAEKEFHRFHDMKLNEANLLRGRCEQASVQETLEDKFAEAQENLRLADVRKQREAAKAQQEAQEKMKHADNLVNSDRMREVHDYKVGSTGRLLKGEYKRLSIEEEADVYNTNAHLVRDKKARARAEAEAGAQDVAHIEHSVSVLAAIEMEKARSQKEKTLKIVEENKKLAAQKAANDRKERRAHLSLDYEP